MTAVIAAAAAFTAITAAGAVLTRPFRLQPAGRHHAAYFADVFRTVNPEDHLAVLRPLPPPGGIAMYNVETLHRLDNALAALQPLPEPPGADTAADTAAWLVSEGWRQAAGRWAR